MAKSRFEYVRNFEQVDSLLKNAWIVVRVDGRSFHRFSAEHSFTKPNDVRGLNLMNACAAQVMSDFQDIVLAYGHSDEYSFVVDRKSNFYQRRSSKILSTVVSIFSSSYAMKWAEHFPDHDLKSVPTFDGRIVLFPTDDNLKDYFRWRQADCHVNNLYNTAFWALIQKGSLTNRDAENALMGTDSGEKNELLFGRFGINYNNEPAIFRKGSIVLRYDAESATRLKQARITHEDLIRSEFWDKFYPYLLNDKTK